MGIERNRNIFNRIAKYYDNNILHSWFDKVQKKAIEISIINKKNARVLDVGCGTGNLLLLLSKNKNLKLFGIDISPNMLLIAREKLRKNKIKAELNLLAVEDLKEKNKYDYIFSTEAFHHFSNQEKALKNMKNALKKSGKLIIVDLNFGILNFFFHLIEPGNSKMNNAYEFRKLFEESKFKNIKQEKIGWFFLLTNGEK